MTPPQSGPLQRPPQGSTQTDDGGAADALYALCSGQTAKRKRQSADDTVTEWRLSSQGCLSILFASNAEHEPNVSTTHTADAENATREFERTIQRCAQRGQVTRTETKK